MQHSHFEALLRKNVYLLLERCRKSKCMVVCLNLESYSYAICDVTVTHDKSAVGLVETK